MFVLVHHPIESAELVRQAIMCNNSNGILCHCRTLDAAALAANPVKLHKVESKLRYEDKMNKLQQQFSKRTSKETQALLKKQGSSAGPVAATDGSKKPMVEPDWRIRLQQLAAINAERLKRLAETLVQMCMINLPSPFKVCLYGNILHIPMLKGGFLILYIAT